MKMASKAQPEVGVRELRDHLSRYLDEVKRGRQLVVTEHGRRVARLVPLADPPDPLDELIAKGLARAPLRTSKRLPRPIKAKGTVSDLVRDQRR